MSASTGLSTRDKLEAMAKVLERHALDGYYLPPEDEHLNEYLPPAKQRIEWLTGFSGESAPALVLPKRLAVYVDGRFHLQVDQEIDTEVVTGYKLSPTESGDRCLLEAFAKAHKGKSSKLGYDPFMVSPARYDRLCKLLKYAPGVSLVPVEGNLVDTLVESSQALPIHKAFLIADTLTGKSRLEKLLTVREALKNLKTEILPLTRLDEIAWLYNLRGGDIPYNPVVESYGLLTSTEAYWFVAADKVPKDVQTELKADGIQVFPYEAYSTTLQALLKQEKTVSILVDKEALTMGTLQLIENAKAKITEAANPITMFKALKNSVEIEAMHRANRSASRAIIRHLSAIHARFEKGEVLSEVDVRADIESKYQAEPNFHDLSFPTIPGIASNSAIIHYSHADENQTAKAGDWYLVDSGCQYEGGTTDTTRTTVLGEPSSEQKLRYTMVLKAHLACASAIFPKGTKGQQLDAICRSPLWQAGMDFAHGTGHGVGAFLNVHEGPNRISKAVSTVTFEPGMVTSIEPGYYVPGWGGIRLENLYVVVEASDKEAFQGIPWYRFESLTQAPFERKLIDASLLSTTELVWLNAYNKKLLDLFAPTLDKAELAWLQAQCEPLT